MIHFTKEVDYGLLLIAALAEIKEGKCESLKNISIRKHLPYRFLGKIVTPLKKSGIVESEKGVNGGYRLVKRLEEIKLSDVLAAYKEDYAPVKCLQTKNNACQSDSVCTTKGFWQDMYSKIDGVVQSYSVKDLISK